MCVDVRELAEFSDMVFMELNSQIYAQFVAIHLNISKRHCPNKNAGKSHTSPTSGKRSVNLGKPIVITIYHSSYRRLAGTK
jgi:hypothetical protein